MTVPSVGPVAARSFKVGVDDPRRFARSRTVGAHFGLTPRRHQSGTSIDDEGRISKQGDVAVREALCAIVAVARRLAGILHRMWVCETDFHVGFGAKVTQRLRLRPAL
jgi:transposase